MCRQPVAEKFRFWLGLAVTANGRREFRRIWSVSEVLLLSARVRVTGTALHSMQSLAY
jgi:hypothetical protein